VSVSLAASGSSVSKKARRPSAELVQKKAGKAPLPPVGPVEILVVAPEKRS
jgi:hypothetical protein